MDSEQKMELPEVLKDLALPAGVLLVITILSALGVTNDLLGRLMRNQPDELRIALTCGLIGVSLPVVGRLIIATAEGFKQPTAAPTQPPANEVTAPTQPPANEVTAPTQPPANEATAPTQPPANEATAPTQPPTNDTAADRKATDGGTRPRERVVKTMNRIQNGLKLLLDWLRP